MESPLSISNFDDETLIILDDSGIASPPVRPFSSTPDNTSGLVDVQGIPWNLSRVPRDVYRTQRTTEFAALEARRPGAIYYHSPTIDATSYALHSSQVEFHRRGILENIHPIREESPSLYAFRALNRMSSCTVQHFQLRHLLSCPNASNHGEVMEWNSLTGHEKSHLVFRLHAGAHSRISTIFATPQLLFTGGYYGELLIKRLPDMFGDIQKGEDEDVGVTMRMISREPDAITNHISQLPHEDKVLIASNDAHVRMYDVVADSITEVYRNSLAVNAAAASPRGKLLALAADSTDIDLVDLRTNRRANSLSGHTGFSFSIDWHPSGHLLASANEDHTVRVWDMRRTDMPCYLLTSKMSPVRCVRFSPDGQVMGVMEECDYVTFFNVPSQFRSSTTVDFFGEISGIDFTPDSNRCYIGCAESDRGGIFELSRPNCRTLAWFGYSI